MLLIDSKRRTRTQSAIAAQTALCLTAVLLFMTLLLDGGMVLSEQRRAQAIADGAALAGANDLFLKYPTNQGLDPDGTAVSSALSNAAANGATNDGATSVVTVNVPPQSGSYQQAGYVEVIVQINVPRTLSSGATPVKARSVARGKWAPAQVGVLLLEPQASSALTISGSGSINVTGGASVIINSSGSNAATLSGSGKVTVASPGQIQIKGTCSGTGFSPAPTQSSAVPDPLRFLPEPNPSSLPVISTTTLNVNGGSRTLSPGVYQGGIAVNGSGSAILLPGIYYMQGGGFCSTGSASITGTGVMIYNGPGTNGQTGSVTLTGSGSLMLTPPASGPYQGISIFQDRTATAALSITGSGSLSIAGTIYAAGANANLTGSGSTNAGGSQYIVRTLTLTGSGALNISWNAVQVAPIRQLGNVE